MTKTGRLALAFSSFVLLALVLFLMRRPSFEGDSLVAIQNGLDIRHCLQAGHVGLCPEGGQFPLYQLIPAFLLGILGINAGAIAHVFCYLSFTLFVAWFFVFRWALSGRQAQLWSLAALVLTSGYDIRYSNSTFGEVLAASLVLGMVAGCLRGKTLLTAACLFGTILTKDTALPFAALLLASAWVLAPAKAGKPAALPVLIAGVLGFALVLAFNDFRYGSFFNQHYLQPQFIVKDVRTQASFFAAIWFSPSGGLVFFWTSFVATLLSASFLVFRRASEAKLRALALLGVWSVLFGLTLGFSKWWAPLGWYSWGPRLMLPWLPASLLLSIYAAAPDFERWVRRIAEKGLVFWPLTLGLAVTAFPHARVLLRYQWVNRIIESNPCPTEVLGNACSSFKFWATPWPILSVFSPAPETLEFAGALLLVSIWILWAQKVRRTLN
jgi:hypothetical protein